jgi:hypothetical protein
MIFPLPKFLKKLEEGASESENKYRFIAALCERVKRDIQARCTSVIQPYHPLCHQHSTAQRTYAPSQPFLQRLAQQGLHTPTLSPSSTFLCHTHSRPPAQRNSLRRSEANVKWSRGSHGCASASRVASAHTGTRSRSLWIGRKLNTQRYVPDSLFFVLNMPTRDRVCDSNCTFCTPS